MTRIDPSRIQALISQNFDNARVPGQLGGHSVQMGQAQEPRVQPSASGFINKVKSLYDRNIRLQRAEEGITRGVQNFDKALSKLLDAMKPDNKGNIDYAKIRRHLEALPGSSHSATSRGVDYNELLGARLKLYIGKMGNDDQLYELFMANRSSLVRLTQKYERLENSLLSGREQKIVHADMERLKMLDAVFSEAVDERFLHPNFNKAFDKLLVALGADNQKRMDHAEIDLALETFVDHARKAAEAAYFGTHKNLNYNEFFKESFEKYAGGSSDGELSKTAAGIKHAIKLLEAKLDEVNKGYDLIDEQNKKLDERLKISAKPIRRPECDLLGKILDFAKTLNGTFSNFLTKFKGEGFSFVQMQDFLKRGGKPEDIAAFKQEGFSVGEMMLYAGFAVTEAKSLKSEYQRLAIPVNEKTIVKDFKASNLMESMKELGSGVANKVYKGVYQLSDGSSFIGVFKPESKGADKLYLAMPASGISLGNQNAGRRNIASHALNDLLGFDVIARAEFGMNKDNKLGIVMEMVHGQSGKKTKPEIFDDPVVRRELTKLQWLDGLTAQVDRHPENYFIETHADGSGKRVIGIDNDISFGQNITDPNHISKAHNRNFNGLEMPPIIDTKMAEAFRKLTPERLEASLSDLLDDSEINAAKQRLKGIKDHINDLRKEGCVINPDQWGSEKVGALLSKDTSVKNATSYVARDKEVVESAAKRAADLKSQ